VGEIVISYVHGLRPTINLHFWKKLRSDLPCQTYIKAARLELVHSNSFGHITHANAAKMTTEQTVENQLFSEAFRLLQLGTVKGRNEAALIMHRHFHRRFISFFMKHRLPLEDAEDHVCNLWLKVINNVCEGKFRGSNRPAAWVQTIATRLMQDYHRAKKSNKADTVSDEDWDRIDNTQSGNSSAPVLVQSNADEPQWMQICYQRALTAFESQKPTYARLITLLVEGYTVVELCEVYDSNERNITSRISTAKKEFSSFIAHCKE
jgi:RNA polymerase sigma factor (sigma-70 family)